MHMKKINNPYLTIINANTQYRAEDFEGFEYEQIDVAKGDCGKTYSFIESRAHAALNNAIQDLQAVNIPSTVNSAGRNFEDQEDAINQFYQKELTDNGGNEAAAQQTTDEYCAKIGYSEHHSGLAVDVVGATADAIVSDKIKERYSDEKYAKSLKFLTKRLIMEKHGFILTYPAGSRLEETTGMKHPETWHWRYIGPEHSQMISRIRDKVTEEVDERKADGSIVFQEVFLEDYVELLKLDTKGLDDKQILELYCETFKNDILKLKNENLNAL